MAMEQKIKTKKVGIDLLPDGPDRRLELLPDGPDRRLELPTDGHIDRLGREKRLVIIQILCIHHFIKTWKYRVSIQSLFSYCNIGKNFQVQNEKKWLILQNFEPHVLDI